MRKENKLPKFTINSFWGELSQVLSMNNSVFIAENKKDQEVYNLILSFTHFFNNLRDTAIISQLVDSEVQEIEKTNNPKFGQFSGMKIFTDNLFFAFILEFMQLLKSNSKIFESNTFDRIIKSTNKKTQDGWKDLLKIIHNPNNKMYNTLLKLRNNLSFHYYQPKKLFEGYNIATKNSKNKMYISLRSRMSETRYYFYDLANQLAIYKIIEEDFSLEKWRKEIDGLVGLILSSTMDIVCHFITSRDAPSTAKAEKIRPIEEFLK